MCVITGLGGTTFVTYEQLIYAFTLTAAGLQSTQPSSPAAAPGNLLEMQILWLHLRPLESETQEVRPRS